jgi:hypothetical protein
MRKWTQALAATALVAAVTTADAAHAGSIENMERERAILLETYLSPDMTAKERHAKANLSKRQLIDLERIVLRDKSLVGRDTPAVSRAFDNYDLSFLVHASLEKDLTIFDHWLQQTGVSKQAVMNATRRRR